MAARCREGLGEGRGRFRYVAMDGERPCFAPDVRFDLVCSSLAFQWFHDLEGAVASLCALLAPGGHLAFTTLAEGSFDEWRAAHRICGRSEEHTSELQSLMRISYAVFCLKKKTKPNITYTSPHTNLQLYTSDTF